MFPDECQRSVVADTKQRQVRGLAANVNRWRGQVGLEPLPEDQVEGKVRKMKVDGAEGMLSDMEGPQGRMLVLLLPDGGGQSTWFFKLMGPVQQVAAQQDSFLKVVGSVRLKR